MSRKEKATPPPLAADAQPAALAAAFDNSATAELPSEEAFQKQMTSTKAEQATEPLTSIVATAVAQARAVHDHAKTAMLDTLHMHVAEFRIRLRAVETHVDGDVLALVQRLKAIL